MKRDANDILREEGADALRAKLDEAKPYEPREKTTNGGAAADDLRPQRDPPENEPLPPLSFVDMSTWDDGPAPPREWLIHERIPMKNVTLVSGEGAAGKSLLMLQLSASTVLCRGWLDWMPEAIGPVLYVSCEDEEIEIRRRLEPTLKMYGATFADLIKGGFKLLDRAGQDAILAAPSKNGTLTPTPFLEQIKREALQLRPAAIILDTSADVFGGNEIDRIHVRHFIGMLRSIAIPGGTAVLLVAHPSLTGISSGTGLSGSTGWHNSTRARLYLHGVKTENGAEPDKDLRELEFMKSNYSAVGEPVRVRWKDGLFVREGSSESNLEKLAREQKVDDLFLAMLRMFTDQKQAVSHQKGPTYAPARFADHPGANGIKNKAFADAMQRLLDARKIKIDEWGPPSKRRSFLALNDEGVHNL